VISPYDLMSVVNRLEKSGGRHFHYMGVDCWPVLRNTFMTVAVHGVSSRAHKLTLRMFVKASIDLFTIFLFGGRRRSLILTDFKYRTVFKEKEYLREASVISDIIQEAGESTTILTQGISPASAAVESRAIYLLTAVCYVLAKVFAAVSPNKDVWIYVSRLFDDIQSDEYSASSSDIAIGVRNIYFVIIARFFLKSLLKRLRPKRCYVVCYYSCIGMALCAAGNDLGIDVVDLQHGVGGRNMRSYGKWVGIPETGFNTLPSSFFCWTEYDKKAIDEWAQSTNGAHRAWVTGNIWRQFVVASEKKGARESYLADAIKGYSKVVVYTARSAKLSPVVIAVLKEASCDYVFLIRVHPDVVEGDLKETERMLRNIGGNVIILPASSCRIDSLMRCADVHITEWSASVYDALFEGVPSIVLTDTGEQYFEAFVKEGFVEKAVTSEEIWCAMKNAFNGRMPVPEIEAPTLDELSSLLIEI